MTGFTIKWLEIVDSFKATVALANDEVELVIANSADIARAFSRDLPARLVYICESVDNSEALVIHEDWHASSGGPIRSPRDLIGREIYVWYGSTAHYALWTFLKEMQIPVETDTTYMRGTDCKHTPCHYTPNPDSITLIGRTQQEILDLWKQKKIIACYVGLPQLNEIKKTGTILFTNRITGKWERSTFSGLLASNAFLDRTKPKFATYNVDNFMQLFILEMAKANFYFTNNTKEFGMKYVLDTIGTNRVSGAIASVTGGQDETMVWNQLTLRQYPTIKEQIETGGVGGCMCMGCGNKSRIAWALKDLSVFLLSLKEDWNVKGGLNTKLTQRDVKPELRSTSDILSVALPIIKDDYSPFIDISYMVKVLEAGQDGTYELPTGVYVHLGYEVMAMFGPTRSLLIA